MVRILRIKKLEERRRSLLERSSIYREMLRVEAAGFSYSVSKLKRSFSPLRGVWRALSVVAPIAGVLLARRRKNAERGGSFISRLLSGVTMATELVGLLKKFRSTGSAAPEEKEEDAAPRR